MRLSSASAKACGFCGFETTERADGMEAASAFLGCEDPHADEEIAPCRETQSDRSRVTDEVRTGRRGYVGVGVQGRGPGRGSEGLG